MCSTEVKDTTTEEKKNDHPRHSFVKCMKNIRNSAVQISCVDPGIENNECEDNGHNDGFITPSDNFERGIQFHNIDQPNFKKCELGVKVHSKNTKDSTPLSVGMITLRKINLFKPICNELYVLAAPVAHPISNCNISNTIPMLDSSLTQVTDSALCQSPKTNMANLSCLQTSSSLPQNEHFGHEVDTAHILSKKAWEPNIARLPTFVPCNDSSNSLCSGVLGLNKLCDPFAYTSTNLKKIGIDVDSINCQVSSGISRHAHQKQSSKRSYSMNLHKDVASKEHSSRAPLIKPQTGGNCDTSTTVSGVTNEKLCNERQDFSFHTQVLPSNVFEFKTPAVPEQSASVLIQPSQKAIPQRSYSCGNVSLLSFDDNTFSPVQITLPPESPQEVSDVIVEILLTPSDKVTENGQENTGISSSDCETHHDTDGKVRFESVPDIKGRKIPTRTTGTGLKLCKNTSSEIKLKVAKSSRPTTKSKNYLQLEDGNFESHKQRQTRSASRLALQKCLTNGQNKESTTSKCHLVRSQRKLRLSSSSINNLIDVPKVQHIMNFSEKPQIMTSSESIPTESVRRSKRIRNTHSPKVNSLCAESIKIFETKNSETLTDAINKSGKGLRRGKHESEKNQKLSNAIKDNSIPFKRPETSTGARRYKKEDQRGVSRMSAEHNNELAVSNITEISEKPNKKTSVKTDKGFDSLLKSESILFKNKEIRRSFNVTNTASRLTGITKPHGISSRNICTSAILLRPDKEQKSGLRAKNKQLTSKSTPTKSKLVFGDSFDKNSEGGTDDKIQSNIHPQSSVSELPSDGIKPTKEKAATLKPQDKIILNSKRKSGKIPVPCDKGRESSVDQVIETTSSQEMRDMTMPQRQLRKRKTCPVEVLPDESSKIKVSATTSSKIKVSATTRSKIKPEKKLARVNASIISEDHVKISKQARKSSKKQVSQVTLDHGTADDGIIEENQEERAATCAATAKKSSKKAVRTSRTSLQSKNSADANVKDTSCTIKQTSQKFVGAHCSIAGGVSNAVKEAASIGARAFALFVRNGRTWKLGKLDAAEAQKFKNACKEYGFPPHLILPHGSYLLNCGSSNPDTLQKSRDTLIHELQICEMLGLELYNFHPGSACGQGTINECVKTVCESINIAHQKTSHIKTVIENMSCQGSTVGGKFEELKAIIDGVKDKSRVAVCLDTCHAFAAGFDLSSESGLNKCIEDFDRIIGLQYLCALHLNDSKGELGCHLDRHENIGKGHIGLDGFRRVMNDPRLNNIPMILETPVNDYAKEIKILCELENL